VRTDSSFANRRSSTLLIRGFLLQLKRHRVFMPPDPFIDDTRFTAQLVEAVLMLLKPQDPDRANPWYRARRDPDTVREPCAVQECTTSGTELSQSDP
jgi:hypothetical protein